MLGLKDDQFISLPDTDMKASSLLERANLQQAIVNSWAEFTKEIKLPDLQFIGQEVVVNAETKGRIDILAFDPNDNVLVVIELKRDKNKLQLLQSISYAAMLSNWSSEQLINEAKIQKSSDLEDIESVFYDTQPEKNIRIILIAESFGPEVIISADWLYNQFNMDIIAISLKLLKRSDELYCSLDQCYPLPELHDSYELRRKQKVGQMLQSEKTWEEVIPTFKYDWGKELLSRCRIEKEGDPSRKRINNFRSNYEGFKWITLSFKINYTNVYMKGKPDDIDNFFKDKFKEKIKINSWRDGYSFHVTSHSQYEDLCKWLKIKKLSK